jgi:hypothetical protein
MNLASANLASAYPDSTISAPMMLLVALVAAGSLAVWLIMVFRADRGSGQPGATRATDRAAVATPPQRAEDENRTVTYTASGRLEGPT